MYIVISKFFDNETQKISKPIYVENAKNDYIEKSNCEIYMDAFDTYKQAQKFYIEQLKG